MLGWLVLFGLMSFGFLVSVLLAARWGRGSYESMSVNMESESASYLNYTRNTHIGG
jgi:hypothetical protein